MCLPTDQKSIIELCEDLMALGAKHEALRKTVCNLCTPQEKCWWCKSWQERKAECEALSG